MHHNKAYISNFKQIVPSFCCGLHFQTNTLFITLEQKFFKTCEWFVACINYSNHQISFYLVLDKKKPFNSEIIQNEGGEIIKII